MSAIRLRLWRLVRLLNMLQSRIGYSGMYLANEFEVSHRTIYRDIRFLEESGVPVRYDAHKCGYIIENYFNPCPSKVSDDELTSLLLAAHIFSLSCAREIRRPIHQAIGKLLAQVPIPLRENVGNLLSAVRGAPTSALWPKGPQAVVAEILSAIKQEREVRITYTPPKKVKSPIRTKVTVHRLKAIDGRWYLIGRSSWHRRVHRFNLEHIQSVEQVDHTGESLGATHIECSNWPRTGARPDAPLATSGT
jgi:predicted DNA-binding transcriptional regulator YafY